MLVILFIIMGCIPILMRRRSSARVALLALKQLQYDGSHYLQADQLQRSQPDL
jgi:hypothetical protein